ncbi:hypothetical protein L249_2112, partial [Ophiocordyceps polyrhachis-furcata BCC 54312]
MLFGRKNSMTEPLLRAITTILLFIISHINGLVYHPVACSNSAMNIVDGNSIVNGNRTASVLGDVDGGYRFGELDSAVYRPHHSMGHEPRAHLPCHEHLLRTFRSEWMYGTYLY